MGAHGPLDFATSEEVAGGRGGHRRGTCPVRRAVLAIGDVIQKRLARGATDERVGAIGLFTQVLRDPQWWLGSLVATVGFVLRAAALVLGRWCWPRWRQIPQSTRQDLLGGPARTRR
jgi:hypothetical protein